MAEKTSNIPISPTNKDQLINKQIRNRARAESEKKRKDGEEKRKCDDDEALKEALQLSGSSKEPRRQFQNLPNIDETGNAVNNEEDSGWFFTHFVRFIKAPP